MWVVVIGGTIATMKKIQASTETFLREDLGQKGCYFNDGLESIEKNAREQWKSVMSHEKMQNLSPAYKKMTDEENS